jgi:YD repeat-containing protein
MSYDGAGNMLASTDGRGNNWNTTYNSWGMKETDVEPATTAYSMASNSTTTYAYDPDGRLVTQARPGGVTQTFDYDTVGNLVDQQAPAPRRRWPRAASRTTRSAGSLTAATSNTSTSGLSNATSESFSYNDRGELLTAGGSAGSTALDYNGDGLPTSRADASGTTTYGYDTNDQLKTLNDALTGTTLSYSYNKHEPGQVDQRGRRGHPELQLRRPAPADQRPTPDPGRGHGLVDQLRLRPEQQPHFEEHDRLRRNGQQHLCVRPGRPAPDLEQRHQHRQLRLRRPRTQKQVRDRNAR